MKQKIFFILSLFFITTSVWGAGSATLSMNQLSMSLGSEAELCISLNNSSDQITGLSCDLYLPSGIEIKTVSGQYQIFQESSRVNAQKPHTLEWAKRPDGAIRILNYSSSNQLFSGTSGVIIKVKLVCSATCLAGSYSVQLKNIVLSRADGTTIEPANATSSVVVLDLPSYNLKYIVDGVEYKTYSLFEGASISPEPEPTKEGYTFSGWSGFPQDMIMPAHDVTITGSFVFEGGITGNCGDNATFVLSADSVLTISGSGPMSAYSISNGASTAPWSQYRDVIKKVVVEDGITNIGAYAFYEYDNISEVQLSKDIVSIDKYAFYLCTNLTSIDIPQSVTKIGSYAFYKTGLLSLEIPEGVKDIRRYAFAYCSNLSHLVISSTYRNLFVTDGTRAFAYCSSISSITDYAVVPQWLDETFLGVPKDIDVFVPAESVEAYKNGSDSEWKEFTNIQAIPGTLQSYNIIYMVDGEEYARTSVQQGASITLLDPPTKEGYTFSGWSGYPEDLIMPAHDVTITGSFSVNQYTLKYLVDGEEYKSYQMDYGSAITAEAAPTKEGYTFSGWSEIPATMPAHDVTVTGSFSVNQYTLKYLVDGVEYKSYLLDYGSAITAEAAPTKEGYTFSGWSEIPATMPAHDVVVSGSFIANTPEYIASGKCGANVTYTISKDYVLTLSGTGSTWDYDNEEEDEETPWYHVTIYNDRIRTAVVEEGITRLGTSLFEESNITHIELPSSLTVIADWAFINCKDLKEITLPEGVVNIGRGAFGSSGLRQITIPSSVIEINEYAFYNCINLTGIVSLPVIPPTIRNECFSGVNKDIPVYVPAASVYAYIPAMGWCDFYNIRPIEEEEPSVYNLMYVVDGIEWECLQLKAGEIINLLDNPTKEGYTFSGWSGYPEDLIMPAHDVTISGSFVKNEEPVNPGSDLEPDTDISAFDNVIYIQNQEVRADGQFVIPVRMNNTAAITAFQFTLTLPEGITIARNDKGKNLIALDEDRKADSHTISSNVLPDGSVTVACLSLESEPFYGNDGVVVNITVDIPADMADGDYAVILKNIEMTSPNNAKYNVDRVKSTMSVISVLPGDVNGDGSITISDAVGIVNFVIMTNTAGLNEKAADANGDGSVSITDAVFVVNEVIHSGFAPARRLPGNGQPLRAE